MIEKATEPEDIKKKDTKFSKPVRQAVILAGGLGTRLGTLTEKTPKPLLPVAGKPFLWYLIEWLSRAGIDDIIISTGYLAGAFESFIRSGNWRDPYGQPVKVTEAREDTPAGTAGALLLMREKLDDRFLLVNGDSFFVCDPLVTLLEAEKLPRDHMLLTVREVPDASSYGSVTATHDGLVRRFVEKGVAKPGLINAGISVMARTVVDLISEVPCSIEQEIYPKLAEQGRLHIVKQDGYFIDIGLASTYLTAQTELPSALRRPAFFFDRDGVLNFDKGYTHKVEDLELMPSAGEAVAKVRAAGYQTVVVSNQAGVAHGLYDEKSIEMFHRALNLLLKAKGGWIDRFYYSPYHPEGKVAAFRCDHADRKPNPGMLQIAAMELAIDMENSFLVGDKDSDVQAAKNAGIKGYLCTENLGEFIEALFMQTGEN